MFSTSTARGLILAAVASALLLPAAAQAAIVVASSGPSARDYPVGRKLDDKAKVTLREGDTVTLLDKKGTRVLRGAGSFAVTQSGGPTKASTFNALTRQRASQRVRTGAVRTGPNSGTVRSPNLWYLDLARDGARCVTTLDSVRLWRADATKPARVTLRNEGTGASTTVDFAAGAMVAPWDPAKLPITPGTAYAILGEGGAKLGSASFAVIAPRAGDAEALAGDLIAHGCSAQLDLLSTSLALQ